MDFNCDILSLSNFQYKCSITYRLQQKTDKTTLFSTKYSLYLSLFIGACKCMSCKLNISEKQT